MATAKDYLLLAPGPVAPRGGVPAGRARMRGFTLVMASSPTYSRRFKIGAVVVLAVAITLFGFAIRSFQDGGEDPVLNTGDAAVVENLIPRRNAQVPQQSNVGIDLVTGWEAELIVNGVVIPRDELQLTPEIGLIEFTPGEGRSVEELEAGENCVSAVIWKVEDGRGDADRTIPWCFDVV